MEKTEIHKKDIEVTTDIICDSCGNSCKTHTDFEYMELRANWGYASKKDMERWTAHICEKCVDEKLSFVKFKKEDVEFQTCLGTESDLKKKMDNALARRNDT